MMKPSSRLTFKVATEPWEIEQIHRLNYRTFVEEIPQHGKNPDGILVDKFHDENTYFICLDGDRVVGMLALRTNRPFSLDHKVDNLDGLLPPGRTICEVRLAAVEKEYRRGRVFLDLVRLLTREGRERGCDLAIISGTTRQMKLYTHLGFVPFGPLVGGGEALFQPMYLTFETVEEKGVIMPEPTYERAEPESFLPGPVNISEEVREVLGGPPVSHRSRSFMRTFAEIKAALCELTGSRMVEIFVGSGTLANDVVGGQISLLGGPGLVLNNGEFGSRLVDHATRWGLDFGVLKKEYGDHFTRRDLEKALDSRPRTEWLWSVHCETSTTILNDLEMLKEVTAARGVKLCVDCTSSVGTVPVDLRGVYLASSVSGKGLGSFPGLSMVFYSHEVKPAPKALPRYLDLGTYAACDGVPYTHSSNLLWALHKALESFRQRDRYEEMRELSAWLRSRLEEAGFEIMGSPAHTSPAIMTIVLPPPISSEKVGDELEDAGYLLSYRSGYLLRKNWLQICLMGEGSRERLEPMLGMLERICAPRGKPAGATARSAWSGEKPAAGHRVNAGEI